MFCPNCGAKNLDRATTCQKCGFDLKSTTAAKFKGTVLMMNASDIGVPGANAEEAGNQTADLANTKNTSDVKVTGPGAGNQTADSVNTSKRPSAVPRPRLKGTMIGVAPPALQGLSSPGSNAPAPARGVAPAHANFPIGATQPQTAVTTPGIPAPAVLNATEQRGSVNPFGGTLAAQPVGVEPTHHPAQPAPAGHQTGGATHGAEPSVATNVGSPGAPTFTGQPVGSQAPMPNLGAPPVPNFPAGTPGTGGPMVAASGVATTAFARSPITVALLGLVTCGVYMVYWFHVTAQEFAQRGAPVGPWWHVLIPFYGVYHVWKWSRSLERVSQGRLQTPISFLLLLLFGPLGAGLLQHNLKEL